MKKICSICALVLALCATLAACTPTVTARNYTQAVAQFGNPEKCSVKADGKKYCSWIRKKTDKINYEYQLIMLFDKNDDLVKSYTQQVFKEK